VIAVVVALVGLEAGYRVWAVTVGSSGSAAWIWAAEDPRQTQPLAFYLVRDFSISELPERAQLLVLADEEYLLYLNGRRIGSNIYRSGAALDRYDVAPLLVVGGNRLVAEVRSRKGSGGFLSQLRVEGEEWVVSDGSWRVLRHYHPGLLGGWLRVDNAEAPRVWGRPPTGRWGRLEVGPWRPLFIAGATESPAISWASKNDPLPWRALAEVFRRPLRRIGWPHSWGWSEVVEGYVELEFEEGAPTAGLVFLSEGPADRVAAAPTDCLLSPPGAPRWSSAVPRRFRHLVVVAAKQPSSVGLVSAPAGMALRFAHPREEGVLGIAPPARNSPLEGEVLRLMAETSR